MWSTLPWGHCLFSVQFLYWARNDTCPLGPVAEGAMSYTLSFLSSTCKAGLCYAECIVRMHQAAQSMSNISWSEFYYNTILFLFRILRHSSLRKLKENWIRRGRRQHLLPYNLELECQKQKLIFAFAVKTRRNVRVCGSAAIVRPSLERVIYFKKKFTELEDTFAATNVKRQHASPAVPNGESVGSNARWKIQITFPTNGGHCLFLHTLPCSTSC